MTEEALDEAVSVSEAGSGDETIDGMVKGTIAYMSPEQAAGKTSEMDRRSDVYAPGCLLSEILTLHPAFKSDGVATLANVRSGDFVPVTERNPRRPVPESLAGLATKAMAKDLADPLRRVAPEAAAEEPARRLTSPSEPPVRSPVNPPLQARELSYPDEAHRTWTQYFGPDGERFDPAKAIGPWPTKPGIYR